MRGLATCAPVGQIVSDGDASFICVGKHDGSMCPVKQDTFTMCFKGPHRDDMRFYDRRDLIDTQYVIAWALSHDELDRLAAGGAA